MNRRVGVAAAGLAVGAVMTVIATTGSRTTTGGGSGAYTLVPAGPADLRTLEVSTSTTRVVLSRQGDRRWEPGGQTSAASATLLAERQDVLFPLRAYRKLRIDPGAPEAGLATPQFQLRITAIAGPPTRVSIGAANFNGAGFYATTSGDPAVYLVSRGAIDVLRSVVSGEFVQSPRPAKETAVLTELPDEVDEGSGPWQRQAVKENP